MHMGNCQGVFVSIYISSTTLVSRLRLSLGRGRLRSSAAAGRQSQQGAVASGLMVAEFRDVGSSVRRRADRCWKVDISAEVLAE